jgi:hypothetical protein
MKAFGMRIPTVGLCAPAFLEISVVQTVCPRRAIEFGAE